MKIDFLNRLNPEMECIALLERRFCTRADASHNIEELRTHLSTTYNIPIFELEPLLAPLIDVENYVNKNLAVREERLRFFFIPRSNGLSSLGGALFSMLQSRLHYGSLSKECRLQELIRVLSRITGIETESWHCVSDLDSLIRFLLSCNCTEDVKWIATALYYAIEEYLEELDVILRKATGLFLDHLPDLTALCQEAIRCAQEQIDDDPSMMFHGVSIEQLPPHVTVIPSAMNFHGLQWDMGAEQLYYGIFYPNLTSLIAKYSDQAADLVVRLKSISDKNRLEILHAVKGSSCNGQDLAERLELSPATISHHTNLLCNVNLLTATKRGTSIYYELNQPSMRQFIQELEHYLF